MSDATANTPIENTNNTVDTAEEMDSEIESLKKENEELRVQSESMRAKLLEANMLANNYLEEMEKLKEQLERITSPPFSLQLSWKPKMTWHLSASMVTIRKSSHRSPQNSRMKSNLV